MVFVRCLCGRADVLFSHFCSEMENSFLQLGDIISFVWKHEQLLDAFWRRLTSLYHSLNGRVSSLSVLEELIISGAARGIH